MSSCTSSPFISPRFDFNSSDLEVPISQISDPVSEVFDSDRVRLEEQAKLNAHLLRIELTRLESERRRQAEEERITRLVDGELRRLHDREILRDRDEKSRLDLIYRSLLKPDQIPVFQTSADLRPHPPPLSPRSPSFDLDQILRRNQRRLQILNNHLACLFFCYTYLYILSHLFLANTPFL